MRTVQSFNKFSHTLHAAFVVWKRDTGTKNFHQCREAIFEEKQKQIRTELAVRSEPNVLAAQGHRAATPTTSFDSLAAPPVVFSREATSTPSWSKKSIRLHLELPPKLTDDRAINVEGRKREKFLDTGRIVRFPSPRISKTTTYLDILFAWIQSKTSVSCPRFWENATTTPNDGTTIPTNNNVDNSTTAVAAVTKIISKPSRIALIGVRRHSQQLRRPKRSSSDQVIQR